MTRLDRSEEWNVVSIRVQRAMLKAADKMRQGTGFSRSGYLRHLMQLGLTIEQKAKEMRLGVSV